MNAGTHDPTARSTMMAPWTLRATQLSRLIALSSQSLPQYKSTASRRAEGSTPREGA